MRKLTLFAAALTALATPALATKPVNPPTLHGFCSLGSTCLDNNTNSPTSVNPPVFAFAASPGPATGTLWIDILVPNNVGLGSLPASFGISGYLTGTATLVNTTPWTSGFLDTYLNISASPSNPIGAYLPATQGFQPTATGFFVFQANVGSNITLPGPSTIGAPGQDTYLSQLDLGLATGSYIVAFLQQSGAYGATANSGAILETGPPPPPGVPEPATWGMMIAGFGTAGFALRRRRRRAQLEQIA
jgi:hypothetical protein